MHSNHTSDLKKLLKVYTYALINYNRLLNNTNLKPVLIPKTEGGALTTLHV